MVGNKTKLYMLENNEWRDLSIYLDMESEILKTLDESFDSAVIKLSYVTVDLEVANTKKVKVELIESENGVDRVVETLYYYANILKEKNEFSKPTQYSYTFNCIEPTQMLQGMFINGFGVTQPIVVEEEVIKPIEPNEYACPNCNSYDIYQTTEENPTGTAHVWKCNSCGHTWWRLNDNITVASASIVSSSSETNVKTLLGEFNRLLAVNPLRRLSNGQWVCKSCGDIRGTRYDDGTTIDRGEGHTAPDGSRCSANGQISSYCKWQAANNPLSKPKYKLDNNLVPYFSAIKSPEFKFSNRMTLFECVNVVGQFIGAMPRLIPDSQDDRLFNTITFDFFNELKDNIAELDNCGYCESINEEEYCTELEADVENMIVQGSNGESSIVFPGANDWITPRTDEIKRTEDNCFIDLPLPIYKINKVLVSNIRATFQHNGYIKNDGTLMPNTGAGGAGEELVLLEEIDITDFIVSQEKRKALKEQNFFSLNSSASYKDSGLWKSNTFYYENNKIKILTDKFKDNNATTSRTILEHILNYSLYRNYKDKTKFKIEIIKSSAITGSQEINFIEISDKKEYGQPVVCTIKSDTIRNLKFRVEYTPYINTRTTADKMMVSDSEDFSQAFNQFSEVNDSKALGNNMWGKVQRVGVSTITTAIKCTCYSSIPKVGDIWNNYIVTSVKIMKKQRFLIIVALELSQDFNRLYGKIGINSKYRQWQIPNEMLERRLKIKDYILISNTKKANTSILCPVALSNFAKTFKNDEGITAINNVTFKADNNNKILTQCVGSAIGRTLNFAWQMVDNYTAGLSCEKETTDSTISTISQDASYVNEKGELENAEIIFGNDLTNGYDIDKLPIITTGINEIFKVNLSVQKDACEWIKGVYIMPFVTDNKDIVIGERLAEICRLVINKPTPLKVWSLTKKVNKFAKLITSEGIVQGTLSASTIDTSVKLSISALNSSAIGWAITDGNNELVLACNSLTNDIYFNFREKIKE